MSLQIVTCPPDRFRELLDVDAVAFAEEMPVRQLEKFEEYVDKERFFAGMDGDRIVASSGIFTFRMTVPGAEIPVGGVTFVAVLPSHRRRGYATAMMRRMFEDCRQRGEPVAALWASEGAIYQRFGYGLATYSVQIEAESQAMGYTRDGPPEGDVRLVALDDALEQVGPVYEAARRPGFFGKSAEWWRWTALLEKESHAPAKKRVAVYECGGKPEAYAIYTIKPDWDFRGPRATVEVRDAIGSTPRGTREIWRYLFSVDLTRTVRAEHLPPDHPLFFLTREPRRLGARIGDGIWLRVLDVAAALEGRRYEGDGRLVFELADSFCPENAGVWSIEVEAGQAKVGRSDGTPGLTLDATDLGALYLGGFSASALATTGRVRERQPGALATADLIFKTALAPWCPEEF